MLVAIIVLGNVLLISIVLNVVLWIMWRRTYNDKKLLWNSMHDTLKESINFKLGE